MKILETILFSSGGLLLAFGFVHFLLLDYLFSGKPSYLKMKWWAGKITLALTIVFFGAGLVMLIKILFE